MTTNQLVKELSKSAHDRLSKTLSCDLDEAIAQIQGYVSHYGWDVSKVNWEKVAFELVAI